MRTSFFSHICRGQKPVSFLALAAFLLISLTAAFASSTGPRASVMLSNAAATISQTSDTDWKLEKTGVVSGSTVTWIITATQGQTVSGHLFITGFMAVTNAGTAGATIGNIVVNLQTKSGSSWVTQSSDVANATHGDAATSVSIDPHASSENKPSFTENAASGRLLFMDANNNTAFSLVPQMTIPAGKTVNLLYSALFDNNVLKLSSGTAARAEVIVSFGNSGPSSASAQNIDINGNGSIDADEAWIRSVPARVTLSVPAAAAANTTPTLTDTAADIATTGTVTFSNPVFDLGTISGTVTAQLDRGTSGGSITNCAHLKGTGATATVGTFTFPNIPGVDVEACNTQTISATACTPGAVGCGWHNGDMVTFSEDNWGDAAGGAANLLTSNFSTVYPTNTVTVGDPHFFSILFSGADPIIAYLPALGTPGVLDATLLDPGSTSSGEFGGEVTALRINVDFSDAGVLHGTAAIHFGDLHICNLTAPAGFNGQTVRQFLGTASTTLSAGPSAVAIVDLDQTANALNNAFGAGGVSSFAQQHLINGACPVCTPGAPGCGWPDGSMATFSQDDWGAPGGAAATLLALNYSAVYPTNTLLVGNVSAFLAGDPGAFVIVYSGPDTVTAFLPTTGLPGALDTTYLDPIVTPAGIFAGEVTGLRINSDLSDAGVLHGTAALKLGDVRICGLTAPTALNGLTVRQFLDVANTALGGGVTPFTFTDLEAVAQNIDLAFGFPQASTFAQQHLVDGACP
jgi:hypothetical protein